MELHDNSAEVPFNERRHFAILKAETNFCGSRQQKISAWTKFFAVLSSGTKHHIAAKKGVLALLKEGIFVFFLAKGTSLK